MADTHETTKKVPWIIFVGFMSAFIIILGIIVTYASSANSKSDSALQQASDIKGDVKAINASLSFQQASLIRIENKLDSKIK